MILFSYITTLPYPKLSSMQFATATKGSLATLEHYSWNLSSALLNNAYIDLKSIPGNTWALGKNFLAASAPAVIASQVDQDLSTMHHEKATQYAWETVKCGTSIAAGAAKVTVYTASAAVAGATYGALKLTELGIDAITKQETTEQTFEQKIANHLEKAYLNDSFSTKEKELLTALKGSNSDDVPSFVENAMKAMDDSSDYGFVPIDDSSLHNDMLLGGDCSSCPAAA
ncbi:MAG: hypothetical protein ACRYE9_02510 [Janthinobacterium lividum]